MVAGFGCSDETYRGAVRIACDRFNEDSVMNIL
jgi:hypothetical protein